MIQVTLLKNTKREKITVDPNRTIREVLEEKEFDYSTGNLNLDGAAMNPGDLDKTFTALGIKTHCFLVSIAKTENA